MSRLEEALKQQEYFSKFIGTNEPSASEKQTAADAFNSAVKNNNIDVTNFHKAFDADLEKLGWLGPKQNPQPFHGHYYSQYVFNAAGELESKGSWGVVSSCKGSTNPAEKALFTMWIAIYGATKNFRTKTSTPNNGKYINPISSNTNQNAATKNVSATSNSANTATSTINFAQEILQDEGIAYIIRESAQGPFNVKEMADSYANQFISLFIRTKPGQPLNLDLAKKYVRYQLFRYLLLDKFYSKFGSNTNVIALPSTQGNTNIKYNIKLLDFPNRNQPEINFSVIKTEDGKDPIEAPGIIVLSYTLYNYLTDFNCMEEWVNKKLSDCSYSLGITVYLDGKPHNSSLNITPSQFNFDTIVAEINKIF